MPSVFHLDVRSLTSSRFCEAVTTYATTTAGDGQDAIVYSNPSVPFVLSPAYPWVGVGKTTDGLSDLSSLMQFDLTGSGLTSAQIGSATLTVFTHTAAEFHPNLQNPDATHVVNVGISPITSSWDRDTAKWTFKPTHGSQVTDFDVNALNSFFTVDVTSLVKDWLDSPSTNFGVWLEATNVIGSGPNGDASPFWAVAFNSGYLASPPFGPGGSNVDGPLLTINTVPEPGTIVLALCAVPAVALAGMRRAQTGESDKQRSRLNPLPCRRRPA